MRLWALYFHAHVNVWSLKYTILKQLKLVAPYHIIYHIVVLKRQNRLKVGTDKPKLKVKMRKRFLEKPCFELAPSVSPVETSLCCWLWLRFMFNLQRNKACCLGSWSSRSRRSSNPEIRRYWHAQWSRVRRSCSGCSTVELWLRRRTAVDAVAATTTMITTVIGGSRLW